MQEEEEDKVIWLTAIINNDSEFSNFTDFISSYFDTLSLSSCGGDKPFIGLFFHGMH
jgi:hypothetical protein